LFAHACFLLWSRQKLEDFFVGIETAILVSLLV